MDAQEINRLCKERGWTRSRLVLELRTAARRRNVQLPSDDSLKRMIREWAAGRRGLSEFYADLLSSIFADFQAGQASAKQLGENAGEIDELQHRLSASLAVDDELVSLLEAQTQSYRLLDRKLGAARLLTQTEAHIQQMSDLLTFSLPGQTRANLAAAVAEAAALAGWQALDLGNPTTAWTHHEMAKAAAREAGNPAVLAHVTAQQAIILLELDKPADAHALVRHALEEGGTKVPNLLRSWLLASEAETLAAGGHDTQARRALELASGLLPSDPVDPELPFIVLDEVHLKRWAGHCLARLGAGEAVEELTQALRDLDPSFTRATAALYCDLALAHSVRGEQDAAFDAARRADELATRTTSARQRRRISRLLSFHKQSSGC